MESLPKVILPLPGAAPAPASSAAVAPLKEMVERQQVEADAAARAVRAADDEAEGAPLLAASSSGPSSTEPALAGSTQTAYEALQQSEAEPPKPTGLRGVVHSLVINKPFDLLILLVIVSSCAVMATQSPLKKEQGAYTAQELEWYDTLEDAFLYIFTAEVVLKVIALQLSGYFAEAWNAFDFVVVSTAWVRVIFPESGNLTVLRAVRVLRALRMVNRVPSLKKIVGTLIGAFPQLANVVTLFCMFIFLFGILGVNLFEGKLHYRCTEPGARAPIDDTALCNVDADCHDSQTCVYYELGPNFGATSYDDVISSWATIFQAVTLEGWVDQMYELEKTTSKAGSIVFYLLVVLIGAFFLVNLFLAVLFDAFAKQQEEEEAANMQERARAEAERARVEAAAAAKLASQRSNAESNKGSQRSTRLSGFKQLKGQIQANALAAKVGGMSSKGASWAAVGERFVYTLIMLNTATMCANHYGESEEWAQALYYLNAFFTTAFCVEMLVKLCSLGPRLYFDQGWNRFDFVVTCCSVADLVLDLYGRDTELLRALRVARVLRLLRLNRKMRRFEETFDKVASLVVNLTGILVLFMVMFAMLGMELFGAKMGSPPPRTHFDDFSSAFVTVFCISSGEDWNAVFASALENGANWSVSALYFIPLFLMDNYILVNLFVAIICWGWEQADNTEQVVGFSLTCHGDPEADFPPLVSQMLRTSLSRLVHYSPSAVKLKTEPFLATMFHVEVSITPSNPTQVEYLLHALSKEAVLEAANSVVGLRIKEMAHEAELVDADDDEEEMHVEKERMKRAHEQLAVNVSLDAGPAEGSLAAEHAKLKSEITKLGQSGALGLSVGETVALCEALDGPLHEYLAAAGSVLPLPDAPLRAPLATAESVAGLSVGFSTLVRGAARKKAEKSAPFPPQPSAKAGMAAPVVASSGMAAGAAADSMPPLALRISGLRLIDQLELLLKQYVTALLKLGEANGTLAAALDDARAQARSTISLTARPRNLARKHDDPSGAVFLPLGDVAAAARTRLLRYVVTSSAFEGFIQLCILCSSAALAFDMPGVEPGSRLAEALHLADTSFTAIFVVEMSLKLLAFGAFAPPDGYFRSPWNQLDSLIVTTSVLSLLLKNVEALGALRAMRALRALRPLRTIQRFPGLKKLVNSLLRSVPGVGDVSQVCLLFLIVYGLFSMFLLMGRMGECNDPSVLAKAQCVGEFTTDEGVTLPRWWGNDDIGNFDNIGFAMLTLFEMSTLEMWPDVMFRAMDTDPHETGVGLRRNANAATMAPFMISWIVLSAFLLINLFVGVVLENFNAIRKKEDGSGFMDEKQMQWAKTMQTIFSTKAVRKNLAPGGKGCFARIRHKCFRLVAGDPVSAIAFEKGVALLVFVNVITMAVKWYQQPAWVDLFSEIVDWFFTIAFTAEMFLKLMGLGPAQYTADAWNLLDGTLVTFSLIDHALQAFEDTGLPVSPTFMRMMRFFRIARLLKLIRVNPGIKRLLATVVVSAPSLANVGVLLLLILYIYAILGVEFFHGVRYGEFLTEDANFSNFGFAMLTLFRCITGESYNGIMHDVSITEAGSAPGRCYDKDGDCGNPHVAIPYFISFVIIGSFVMLNVFIAVILDAFAADAAAEQVEFGPLQIDEFTEVWQRFEAGNVEVLKGTPRGISTEEIATDNVIPTTHLVSLLKELRAPMGFKDALHAPTHGELMERVKRLGVPDRGGFIAFHDLLQAFAKQTVGEAPLPPADSEIGIALREVREATLAEPVYERVKETRIGVLTGL